MEIFYSFWFWLAVVIVAAIIAGSITSVVQTNARTKRHIADAAHGGDYKKLAEESATTNARLLKRLDAVESRLAAIEKTLTDIP